MEPINNLIGKAVTQAASPMTTQAGSTESTAQSRQQSGNLLNQVFRSLKAIFPAWAVAIKDPEIESQARAEWLKGLIESGINSDSQINAGLAKCRAHTSPFLPSIGQFVAWCKESVGQMSNMPSESEARLAMVRELGRSPDIRAWHQHHPAVYWVYGRRASFDWKQMSTKDLNTNFHELWETALKMAKNGYIFSAPAAPSHQIESKVEAPAPAEVSNAARSELLAMFDQQTAPVVHDERLERLQRGE